jgi:hypothetical protein
MDQQLTVLYLSTKKLSAVANYDDLVATLGAEAVSHPPVTRYLRKAIFASSNPLDPLPPPEHQLDDSDQVILLALADQPFASIHELSWLTHLPRTTAHRRLTQSLGFYVRHLRWLPHFLSRCQKLDRVRSSQRLFLILEWQRTAILAGHCDAQRVMVLPAHRP